MRSNLFVTGLTIALGFMTPIVSAIGFPEITVAQTVDPRKVEADRFLNLGVQQFNISKFEESLKSSQQALLIYREIRNRKGEGNALLNLGSAYYSLNNYVKAIDYHEQSLAIAREIKDRKSEVKILGNLGDSYRELGNYDRAIGYQEQRLIISRDIKDRQGEGNALRILGIIYREFSSNYAKAIEFHGRHLEIAREIKDRKGEGNALHDLAITYGYLGSYDKTLEHLEKSLVIAREIKDFKQEGRVLGNLGVVNYWLGNYTKAIEYQEQHLGIARKTKSQKLEANALLNLGREYHAVSNYLKAVHFLENALIVVRRLKMKQEEGYALTYLGDTHNSLGNHGKALEYQEQSLAIAREINNRDIEYRVLSSLGSVLAKHEPQLAIVFYKQSVSVAESIRKDNRPLSRGLQSSYTETIAKTYRNLADLLLAQGRVLEAQQVLELLKVQELRDFTKDTRYGGTADRNLLNSLEKPITNAFDDKIKLGDRLTQCEQTKCSDRSQLIAQVTQANETFEQTAKRLKAALKSQESKDPAQLQNEEFTRNAQNIILNNPRKTLLLYPLVLDDKLWLVWGTQAGKKGVIFDSKEIPVSRKDLSAQVLKLSNLLKTPSSDPKEIQQVSQQLYQWLIQPIRQQLTDNGIQNIVFSLDRATRYIPMAALHDGKQYLIENFTLSTILTTQTDTTDKLSPTLSENPVLGFGVTQAIGGFGALPAVQSELDSISKIFPGMKRFDQDFTEAALRENITDHRILHIATHGTFAEDPNDSFLLTRQRQKTDHSRDRKHEKPRRYPPRRPQRLRNRKRRHDHRRHGSRRTRAFLPPQRRKIRHGLPLAGE